MAFKLDIKTEKSKPKLIQRFIQLIYESKEEVLSVYRFTFNNNLYEVDKYCEGTGWVWNGKTVTVEETQEIIKSGNCFSQIEL